MSEYHTLFLVGPFDEGEECGNRAKSQHHKVSPAKAAEIQAILDRKEEKSWKEKLGLPWHKQRGGSVIGSDGVVVCRERQLEAIVAAMNGIAEGKPVEEIIRTLKEIADAN